MKKEKEQPHHLTKATAEPIQIHHDSDETLLARWLRQGMEKGMGFWVTALGLSALAVALVWALNAWLARPPAGTEAWNELLVPSTVNVPADDPRYEGMPAGVRALLKIADDHPNTSAAPWALLRAAAELHRAGMGDLPTRRESARPMLQQAIDLYDRVLKIAPANSPEALDATLGKARAQETRGDLDDAIASYKRVAANFPASPEAEPALRRAKDLDDPDVRTFYTDFYAKDFSSFGATPGGMPGGMTPFGTAPGGRSIEDILKGLPGLSDSPAGGTPARPRTELPGNLFAPSAPEGAKGAIPPADPKSTTTPVEQPTTPPETSSPPANPPAEPVATPPSSSTEPVLPANPPSEPAPAPAPETPKLEP